MSPQTLSQHFEGWLYSLSEVSNSNPEEGQLVLDSHQVHGLSKLRIAKDLSENELRPFLIEITNC